MDLALLSTIRDNFTAELKKASSGEKSSLSFIRNPLPSSPLVSAGALFQVMVVGGSVFRTGLMRKTQDHYEELTHHERPLPTFHTKEDLLQFIEPHIEIDVSAIAVNFAYPLHPIMNIKGVLDGELLYGTKEHTFKGLIGHRVGAIIHELLRQKQQRDIPVAVANDVVCLLLSGMQRDRAEHYVGSILGTGINSSIIANDDAGISAVNLEAANFSAFEPSDLCLAIDKQSASPGKALFEKEIAGEYVYQQFNLQLAKEGIPYPPLTSSKQVHELASSHTEKVSQNERKRLREIATSLLDKSAGMFAAQLTGIADYKRSPITVLVEGSFYWNNPQYQQRVAHYLSELSSEYPIIITSVPDSSIRGGARLLY